MSLLDPEVFDLTENLHVVEPTNGKASAVIVFLGGNIYFGSYMRELLEDFYDNSIEFPHVKWLIPEAPFQVFTPMNMYLRMWYDRQGLDIKEPEVIPSMDRICKSIVNLVKPDIRNGIPIHRMVIGGYSQGATVALYLGLLRYLPDLAGICTISPYFSYDSQLFKFGRIQKNIRIFMAHGALDEKFQTEPLDALIRWKKMGARELYINVTNGSHRLSDYAVSSMMEWLWEVLPPLKSDKIVTLPESEQVVKSVSSDQVVTSDDDRDSETGIIKSKRLKLDEGANQKEEESNLSEKETTEIQEGEELSEGSVKNDDEVQETGENASETDIIQETEKSASNVDTEPINRESCGNKIVEESTNSNDNEIQESSKNQESKSSQKMEVEGDRI